MKSMVNHGYQFFDSMAQIDKSGEGVGVWTEFQFNKVNVPVLRRDLGGIKGDTQRLDPSKLAKVSSPPRDPAKVGNIQAAFPRAFKSPPLPEVAPARRETEWLSYKPNTPRST
eukprot:1148706-Pelagomonas_calceolata.AAC.7